MDHNSEACSSKSHGSPGCMPCTHVQVGTPLLCCAHAQVLSYPAALCMHGQVLLLCGTMPQLLLPMGSPLVVCCMGTLGCWLSSITGCTMLPYPLVSGHAAETEGERWGPETLPTVAAGVIGAAVAR